MAEEALVPSSPKERDAYYSWFLEVPGWFPLPAEETRAGPGVCVSPLQGYLQT